VTDDVITSPTPERLAKYDDWETPKIDRRTARRHHRMRSIAEGMHDRGWISDEQLEAFRTWERHLDRAERIHVPMCRYGRPITTGDDGTPWSREDHRTQAVFKVREAVTAIGYANEVRALALAALTETTLEKIGASIDGTSNKGRAITAGKMLLQGGTYRLAVHYGYIRGP